MVNKGVVIGEWSRVGGFLLGGYILCGLYCLN